MMRWNFSLRTMFVVMLVVASFCTGWVCKERWDRPPAATPAINPTQTRRVLELLTDEHAHHLRTIREIESQLNESAGGIEGEFKRAELARAIRVQDLISERIDKIRASLGGTSISLWIVKAALLVSTLVLSCAVGIRIGKQLSSR